MTFGSSMGKTLEDDALSGRRQVKTDIKPKMARHCFSLKDFLIK